MSDRRNFISQVDTYTTPQAHRACLYYVGADRVQLRVDSLDQHNDDEG